MTPSRLAAGAAGLGGVGVLAHGLPSVTTWPALRRTIAPRLAGLGRRGHVALTFDDGPDPASTPLFLDTLAELGVCATFFLLGEMVERAPGLAGEVAKSGHEVAVHGYRHRYHLLMTLPAVCRDVARAGGLVESATGQRPRWFRPPYGVLGTGSLIAARRAGLTPVLWSAWGRDWTPEATPQSVQAVVARGTVDGGTVLLHDSDATGAPGAWRATLAALPSLVSQWRQQGLTVGPLRDHWGS